MINHINITNAKKRIDPPGLFVKSIFPHNPKIKWNNDIITSTTTIPHSTPLDSIWIEETEDTQDNKYKCEINARYTDPDTIGNNIQIGGGSGVIRDIKDNSKVMGYPAKDLRKFIKEIN